MIKKYILVLSVLTFFLQPVYSQHDYEELNFKVFSSNEGFYNDRTTGLLQDKEGLIWIGTNEGLYTYNGHQFDNLNLSDTNVSDIVNGNIQQLFKDKAGNVWIAANSGVCVYDVEKGEFLRIKLPAAEDYFITGITQDSLGFVWLAANMGIYKISSVGEVVFHFIQNQAGELFRLTFYLNRLWLINYNTVYVFDTSINKVTDSVQFNADGDITDNLQTAICTDRESNIWIGKYNGLLYKFNTTAKSVEKLDIKKETNNPAAIINHLYYDTLSNQVWTSVDEGGIYKIEPATNILTPYVNRIGKSTGIPTLKVSNLLIDRERNIWVSMENYGLAMTNDLIGSFSLIDPKQHTSSSIVSTVLKDSRGHLWVGTDGGGLLRYSSDYKFKDLYKHTPGKVNSLSNDAVLAITEDSKGRIWIGTFRGGLSLYHPESNSFTHYQAKKNKKNGLIRNDIRKIVEDKDGSLWLAAHGHGVTKFSPSTGEFTHYRNSGIQWLTDLLIDYKGTVWVVSHADISYFDKNNKTFISIKPGFSNQGFQTLYEDKQGRLWIGSRKGLYFISKGGDKLQQLGHPTILNHTSVESIEETSDGILFIATRKGIVLYNVNKKQTFYYSAGAGLPADQFIVNSSCNFSNKLFFFGTNKGLCYFNPAAVEPLNFNHKPLISSISLFNEPVKKVLALNSPVSNISSLNLNHNQNNITLNFTYPYYKQSSSEYYFQYMMEGIDKTWKVTTSPVAVYPSLPPGNFKFKMRVLSKGSPGHYSPEAVINFQVSPPFWITWWFQGFALIILVIAFYYHFRKKTRNIITANKELEEKVAERTEAISMQKELLEIQRAELEQANNSKDKLFSIIAHDLRSPFNSIRSITNLFQNKYDMLTADEQLRMVSMLRQTSENTFQLLENLLQWAKSQTHSIKYNPEKISLTDLIGEIVLTYKRSAEDKKIQLNQLFENEIIAVSDKEMLSIIFRNLINNSIKYTPQGGSVSIKVKPVSHNQFSVEIKDSGQGMTEAKVEEIKKSNQFLKPQQGTSGEYGTGLGLSLCRQFLPLVNGQWEIISEPEKGTAFVITVTTEIEVLPAGKITLSDNTALLSSDVSERLRSPGAYKNKVILIVEDQPEVLHSLSLFLSDHFQVLTAKNGSEAWEVIQNNYIDLILSDVVMPEMDGITFTVKCKEDIQTNHIPVILLTSQKEEIDMIKGLQAGVDDYLLKPVNPEVLLLKINQLLNSRAVLKKKFSLNNKEILDSINDNSVEKEFLNKVLKIIDEDLGNESFGVEELSRKIGMHRSSLSKKLVAIAEVTPNELIKIQRLKKGAELLLTSGLNVSQAAYEVGFSDPKYFSRSFKAYFGSLPTEYLQMKS